MPLDHYVPQVYLRGFYSHELGERLHAIHKSDMRYFTPGTKAICAITDGSTNEYLREDRLIEEFLRPIESNYNDAVLAFTEGELTEDAIYVVAGLVAFISSCSPAAMRIYSKPIEEIVEDRAKAFDKQGRLPIPPESLGGKNFAELLNNGKIQLEIDRKYAQSIGIRQVLEKTVIFGNFYWEIIHNPFNDNPFFTSDFPVAIEQAENPHVVNRIFPLNPYLAVRIFADLDVAEHPPSFSFSKFRYKFRELSRKEVRYINQIIVRCAETTVFFSKKMDWVKRFVYRNSRFRIEIRSFNFPTENGEIRLFKHEIAGIVSDLQ
jgi:hypothetical protein